MTMQAIDQVFGAGEPETTEISLTKGADLVRGAISKAVAEGTPEPVTKAITQRAYHLTKAMAAAGEGDTVTVDKALLEAVELDAADAVVKGSMSEAMERLAKMMTPAPGDRTDTTKADPKPDTGGQPPADATPSGDVDWPSDLNTAADPDGLDDWGKDPDLNAAGSAE